MHTTPKEVLDKLIERLFKLAGKDLPHWQDHDRIRNKLRFEVGEAVKLFGRGIGGDVFKKIWG